MQLTPMPVVVPGPASGEEVRRAVPDTRDGAETGRGQEKKRERARVEPRPEPTEDGRGEADGEYGRGGVRQPDNEGAGGKRRDGSESKSKRRRLDPGAFTFAEREHVRGEDGGDRAGGDPTGQHLRCVRGAALWVASEDDQIRQVRAGEKQRGCVCHEHRAVQERSLVQSALPSRVHEDGGEEHDRRVEVEDGGDESNQAEQRKEQAAAAEACLGKARPECLKQSVGSGHSADQEQSGNQYERWPRLPGGR